MNSRQEQLLDLVIKKHIATAEPIGSRFLVTEAGLDWSEATVRNDLRELEDGGFLSHPHTSAGRVPTEQGYRYFADHLMGVDFVAAKKDIAMLEKAAGGVGDAEARGKQIAKALAEVSNETVIMAFSENKVYYTGLANLFQKPEFMASQLVTDVSLMFDRCEECLTDLFSEANDDPQLYIGSSQPFGPMLSVVAVRVPFATGSGLVALLGPLRMDYRKNMGLIKHVGKIFRA